MTATGLRSVWRGAIGRTTTSTTDQLPSVRRDCIDETFFARSRCHLITRKFILDNYICQRSILPLIR
ncbi:unnamed protein product [Urochloa humidicola]